MAGTEDAGERARLHDGRVNGAPPSGVPGQRETHVDHVVGVGHHGDQQVEEHNDVDHGVRAEHEHGPEPREGAQTHQLEGVQFNETERGPKQGLGGLEQAAGVRTKRLVRRGKGADRQIQRTQVATGRTHGYLLTTNTL